MYFREKSQQVRRLRDIEGASFNALPFGPAWHDRWVYCELHLPSHKCATGVAMSFLITGRFTARFILSQQSARRGLATAATTHSNVAEIPKVFGTTGRYATALYSAALKQNSFDAVSADVTQMQSMQSSSASFDDFLRNPTLARSAKVDILSGIVQKAGFSRTFSDFLLVVAENGRSGEIEKILSTFDGMVASTKGEVVVKVTTTLPLTNWELALLKKNIKERFYPDSVADLIVETLIDESLLGGLTIQIGDRFMDLSARTELRKLTEVIGST
jgi:F-type H+-transporting ATPase subunit O